METQIPTPEHPKAYREGYGKGCVQPREERARRSIWANAVLVAENARLRQRLAVVESELKETMRSAGRWRAAALVCEQWCPRIQLRWNCRTPFEDGQRFCVEVVLPRASVKYSQVPRYILRELAKGLENALLNALDEGVFEKSVMTEVKTSYPYFLGKLDTDENP